MGRDEVIVLDTHAAIWFTTDDLALGKESRLIADEALREERLFVSAISFWEIAMLIAKRRLRASSPANEQRVKILASGVREAPLTGDIALLAVDLGDLPGDPADRFIVATAIAHDATLVTADATLLRWRHRLRRQNAAK
jgi:PIN domain nuclease of toxin-antitoxin system